jgi:predicted dehydrogenase
MQNLKIGFIGLDTSHVAAFAGILNGGNDIPGATVAFAYPGGSPDFELSISRVQGFTDQLRDQYGVQILDSPEEVAGKADAVMIEAADGRTHRDYFERIVDAGKPVFIDKPLAVNSEDAKAIFDLAARKRVRVMSSSSLRFAAPLVKVLSEIEQGSVFGADFYGPLYPVDTQPGLFWYGIHGVEMAYAALGTGCERVTAFTNADHEFVIGQWKDGRIGTVRGNRKGNSDFGGTLHAKSTFAVSGFLANQNYAGLLEEVLRFFRGESAGVAADETMEIIRFIEAANQSRATGKSVAL